MVNHVMFLCSSLCWCSSIYNLAFDPLTYYCLFLSDVFAMTMFVTIFPLSFVPLSISVQHFALSFTFALHIFTIISVTIWPCIYPFPIFQIIQPISFISLSWITCKYPFPLKFIIPKLPLKYASFVHQYPSTMSFII